MIDINTDEIHRLSQNLATCRNRSLFFKDPLLRQRHNQIQTKLETMISYFQEQASFLEQNEKKLNFRPGKYQVFHKEFLNVPSILQKKSTPSRLEVGFRYTMQEAKIAYQNEWLRSHVGVNLGDIKADAEARCVWFKNKSFDPDIKLELDADASLASANLRARVGGKKVYADLDARGAVGSLYADCFCILNKKEQSFKAAIGAAAVRGEASVCFNVFGVKITLTGQGSLLSAEANIEYKHANREWMFGSKLGFIAGLGFKIRVNY